MKITKELQAKINRIFNAKDDEARKAYADAILTSEDEYKLAILNDVKAIQETAPALYDLLAKFTKYNTYRCSEAPSVERIAESLTSRVNSPEREELIDQRDADLLANARAKEDFLIQISYAEDLTALKNIFESFGLTW